MKWFTPEFDGGELDDAAEQAVLADCERYITAHRSSFPVGLQSLVEGGGTITLHDATFIDAGIGEHDLELDIATRDRSAEFLVGNTWHSPLLHVHICYRDYELVGISSDQLLWRSFDAKTEILRGEIEILPDGRFEHRMLLWPYDGWPYNAVPSFEIRCRTAELVAVRFANGSAETFEGPHSD